MLTNNKYIEILEVLKMKLVKIINSDKKYTDKNGKTHVSVNYYVVLDNNKWVAIRPSFKQGYSFLDAVSEVIKNGNNK